VKSGVLTLGVATAGISTATALQRTGHVSAATLAPSLQSFWSGRVWLVATSALVADRPAVPSIAGFVVVGLAALAVARPRVVWLSAALGHVGSALAVYGGIELVRATDPNAFASVLATVDYGTSAVIAAWLGAIAYRLWSRDPRLSIGLCVAATLVGWALHASLTVLDSEHLVAFGIGLAVARLAHSSQKSATGTPSPPSGRSEPTATISRPSGPASNARATSGATRITSHCRTPMISSSSFKRPEPETTTYASSCSRWRWAEPVRKPGP
jgi:hypothetical protein